MDKIKEWMYLTARMPILCPVTLILGLLVIIAGIFEWLLGFWRCDECGEKFWITEKKTSKTIYVGDGHYLGEHLCSKCSSAVQIIK